CGVSSFSNSALFKLRERRFSVRIRVIFSCSEREMLLSFTSRLDWMPNSISDTNPASGFVRRSQSSEENFVNCASSQDVKLSNISRSLQEKITLIRTEKRLSRNLKSAELEKELTPQLVRMGSSRIQPNTVLALDLSDIRKEYAQKMENLATVRDGSTGELHKGYWLCDVTGAEVNGSEIVPLYQKLYSAEAKDFTSENAEVLAAVDLIRTHTQGRGIWTIDRGGDRKKLLEP